MKALPFTTLSLLACVCFTSVRAEAAGDDEGVQWKVGGDLALLLREEAAGFRTPLPSAGPRLNVRLHERFELSSAYRYTYAREGTAVVATNQLHRFFLRPELHLPFRHSDAYFAAGPMLDLLHTRFSDANGKGPSADLVRAGVAVGAGMDLEIARWTFRAGVDGFMKRERWDVSFGIGGLFDLGGGK